MKAYIHKYKLAFFFLFILLSGVASAQNPPQIDSMVYTAPRDPYIFDCRKATPIDLFKAANLYVSAENGYWGDINGVPYNGKAGLSDTIKERQYTDGNIFTPPTSVVDTGMYKFYFYFTSSKEYCGIKNGTRFVLNLYLGAYGCLEPVSVGELDNTHYFCFGSSVDMNPAGKHEFTRPVTIENLLLQYSKDPINWKQNRMMDSDWVPIDVYSDRDHKNKIGTGDMEVKLDSAYSATYYVIIHQSSVYEFSDSINITVYPQARLDIFYSPDITRDQTTEYDIDDKFTITVDTTEVDGKFNYFTFFLNNQNLNKYYLGGDTTQNEIVLSALAFTGVEDFIEIVGTDKNNCIVRQSDNVIVHVPFPTVFTPDGDGINDVFLGGEKFRNREFHLEVSNRWGNRLYYGESGWDGTYRGNKVPAGTYLYVLILKTEDGSTKTVKGAVTIIRESR
ncbi:MAG: gliding motility-associated C-terminal domain-containing protein [Prevotellaceae bacterium]|jgi:gliding motility-associated-like protein|nr:gliding motility-associated C-terminal domain-containing protein [Prevotellaceae bacterium]